MGIKPDYERDGITLYCGDCLEILPTLDAGSIDAVVTDPPYGISYCRGTSTSGIHTNKETCNRHAGIVIYGDNQEFDPSPMLRFGNVLLWGADHYSQRLPHGRFLAWDKLNGKKSWDSFSDVEFAWHSKRAASRIISYLWKGLCQGGGEDKQTKRIHPTQKPVAVMRWSLDQAQVPQGGLVLDPFMGSGTTGIACIRTERRFIGIEIDERWFTVAVKRIENELQQPFLAGLTDGRDDPG
jgi:site-specific DNA-methyltransferase (adenine-specific)